MSPVCGIFLTIYSIKLIISACGRSAQSRVKKIAQCDALALYQEEHSQSCSSARSNCDSPDADFNTVVFVGLFVGAGFIEHWTTTKAS